MAWVKLQSEDGNYNVTVLLDVEVAEATRDGCCVVHLPDEVIEEYQAWSRAGSKWRVLWRALMNVDALEGKS